MKILLIGASGMLGRDVFQVLKSQDFEIIAPNSKELDIVNFEKLDEFINIKKPDIIINCAGYTDVEKAQIEFGLARKVNYFGCLNLAKICAKNNIILFHFSTDYVFDGEKNEPYLTSDTENPINNYGLVKLQGERAIQKNCEKFYIIRTSWLFGKNGNNFVEKMLALANSKKEIKVVDDEISAPTYTLDLAKTLLELFKKPFGIYHIVNSGFVSRYDFAKEIFKLKKIDVELVKIKSKDFKTLAKRPKFSALKSDIKLRSWQEALEEYLK